MKLPYSMICVALAAFVCLVAANPALAQTAPQPPAPASSAPEQTPSFLDEPDTPNNDSGMSDFNPSKTLTRVVLVMVLLFALLLGGLMLFQRLARRGLKFGGESRPLRLVDRLVLGPKSSVCLVQTCGKVIVLGVSDGDISVLMDMDASPQPENTAEFSKALEQQSKSLKTDNGPAPF